MNKKSCLPIREFARLTGIRKENLRFYDRIGLLSPEFRADNNYRYYTRRQLNTAYLITSLRNLGVSLNEIKTYASECTLSKMLTIFEEQSKRITAELDRLHSMQEMLDLYADMAKRALQYQDALLLESCAREPIFAIPELCEDMSEDDEVVFAYEYAQEHGVNSGCPLGAILHRPDFSKTDVLKVRRYYFKTKRKHNSFKPAGQYAIAYGQCALGKPETVCKRLLEFVAAQNLTMVGGIYEEYPLSELPVDKEHSYCVRLSVRVK